MLTLWWQWCIKIAHSSYLFENLFVEFLFSAHSLHHGPEVVPPSGSPALHKRMWGKTSGHLSISSQMALYPVSSLPHWRHSCLDLHLQRPNKIYEDEDVEELYTKVSTCTIDCDVHCSVLLLSFCFPRSVLVDTCHLAQYVCTTDWLIYKCLRNSHLDNTCSFLFLVRRNMPIKTFSLLIYAT